MRAERDTTNSYGNIPRGRPRKTDRARMSPGQCERAPGPTQGCCSFPCPPPVAPTIPRGSTEWGHRCPVCHKGTWHTGRGGGEERRMAWVAKLQTPSFQTPRDRHPLCVHPFPKPKLRMLCRHTHKENAPVLCNHVADNEAKRTSGGGGYRTGEQVVWAVQQSPSKGTQKDAAVLHVRLAGGGSQGTDVPRSAGPVTVLTAQSVGTAKTARGTQGADPIHTIGAARAGNSVHAGHRGGTDGVHTRPSKSGCGAARWAVHAAVATRVLGGCRCAAIAEVPGQRGLPQCPHV